MDRRPAHGGTLVLGGGFAGSYVARLLGRNGATIVSRENFMLYTPLLPEAASGTLEPRHVVVPLREMCPHAELLLGEIVAHERDARRVRIETLAGPVVVAYERLVVALGATTRLLPVPGLEEHGVGFKDLPDAIALRNDVALNNPMDSVSNVAKARRLARLDALVGRFFDGLGLVADQG